MKPLRDDAKRRADRQLSASMKPTSSNRPFSDRVPDRFKDGDDAQFDFTAPPRGMGSRDGNVHYMQQSLFSMIAAVGSKSDFHARFDESSDSDGEMEEHPRIEQTSGKLASRTLVPSSDSRQPSKISESNTLVLEERGRRHQRTKSDNKLLQRLPRLDSEGGANESSNQPNSMLKVPPLRRTRSATPRAAPVLSRMVEAQSHFDSTPATPYLPSNPNKAMEDQPESSASALSTRLMKMFGFAKPEKVLVEYACSLLQSMLLQGYMYVTEGHICFYAYLPKKSNVAIKSGYLSKRGRKNPTYHRYWFALKGDVLSYYADPSNLYFPSGHVDLRYGISASLAERKDGDAKDFQVTTDQRTYLFRADSATSAKEWVKALQKVIFRTHNEGDSVKVSFPIANVIDLEESPMADFAETFKIRVLDSGETYAIDEYFFSFFDSGQDALNYIKGLVNAASATTATKESLGEHDIRHQPESSRTTHKRQSVSSVRVSDQRQGDSPRKRSSSVGNENQGSADSFAEQGTGSSPIIQSMTDTTESASQILHRSDVFQSPTMHTLQRRTLDVGETVRRHSDDTTPSASARLDLDAAAGSPSGTLGGNETTDDTRYAAGHSNPMQSSRPSSVTHLNELVKAGAYPLQRAAGFAEYLKSRSKQMSTLLATESMGYIEKVSGMWIGGQKHYGEREGPLLEDQNVDPEDNEGAFNYGDRFRAHFALPSSEKLQATYYAYLHRVLPLYGKIYISQKKLCFRSLIPGTRTKMILPFKDIENVEKEKGFRFGYHGLVVIIRGHEELFFEFNASDSRDDCAVTLHQNLESVKFLVESGLLADEERDEVEAAKAEHRMLQEARLDNPEEHDARPSFTEDSSEIHPFFDDPRASIINFKPLEPLRITCLTIGSRGDVQPYIALCKGLLAEGHKPKIATHAEFEPWIRKHGIDFAPVDGDPAELMRICVENGMFTYSFLREASLKFRGWIDDLLSSAWIGCQGSDLLIESPSAMAGVHIAEALRIPYFRGFTMPWTRTRAYPHAFAVPENRMGGAYNYITYVMFDNIFWKAIAGQVNRWRNNELGLKATTLDKMQQNKVPFLYNYSPSVVAPPLDYPDWIRITGYWFLNEGTDWTPPIELSNFIAQARADGKKLVYIGFGSIVVSDPAALTRTVIESVQKADVRCILSKGWSDRLGDPSSMKTEIPLPPEIHQIQSAPHDWLFSQIDAAAHHGGAGTTGASLRAGVPTIVKPFFGDQFFFGSRVEDLGVGICMKKLNVSVFSRALWEVTHSERMIVKARNLGIQIRNEDGVATAIQALYRDLEYAKTLARQKSLASSTPFSPTPTAKTSPDGGDDDLDDIEEWTFVGDETGFDISKRMRERAASDADRLGSNMFQ
ncbi:GRAM [Penicillium camemberti]|uniref:Sterol 3-beta-glucosyltransferase n=1 Tax=Penicillium camemberti (strain FM 013) TaxID=1429867 RepID=A0A0G4NUB7_PENC3|nr:GRAM [Penicillium camemberti]